MPTRYVGEFEFQSLPNGHAQSSRDKGSLAGGDDHGSVKKAFTSAPAAPLDP